MTSPLVIALYRTLLQSTQTLQQDIEAGRTLFNAVRSGAVSSYAGAKRDWQRERMFVRRFEDVRGQRDRVFATLVRSGFTQSVKKVDKAALDARIDAAFDALKSVDDHNALIYTFKTQGLFVPKERTNAIKFFVGDVVKVEHEKRGVIFAWHVTTDTVKRAADSGIVYDVLPHSPGFSFASKLYHVPQDALRLDQAPKAVVHPALLLYFDGFDGTHHIASEALAARYPSDISGKSEYADVAIATPSIIQLQSADEDKLLTYLRCDDRTIVQFAMASLEGMWLSECGQSAQNEVQCAVELVEQKKRNEAREMLQHVVHNFPEYAYAWNKLAMVEYQSGNFGKALGHNETAVKLKPQLVEALVGLGTCAIKLQRWSLAHRTAVQLLEVQPNNNAARILIEQAIYATL